MSSKRTALSTVRLGLSSELSLTPAAPPAPLRRQIRYWALSNETSFGVVSGRNRAVCLRHQGPVCLCCHARGPVG